MNESKFEQHLQRKLKEAQLALPLHFFEEIASTNELAKKVMLVRPIHGSIFMARRQQAGRGTYGRSFFSEIGGIYCSLLINVNEWHFEDPALATIFTAVAVKEAVHDVLGMRLELKWVNDLFLKGKKVGGILTEKQFNTDWLVVGIGLNVSSRLESFPGELRRIVSTLAIDDSDDEIKASLVVAIVKYMFKKGKLSCKNEVMTLYKASLFILNQQVELVYGDALFRVYVSDVDLLGRLVVQKACGETLYLQAGEVKLVL